VPQLAYYQATLDAIARLPQLEELRLDLMESIAPLVSLAALQCMPSLRQLYVFRSQFVDRTSRTCVS
jgi:hypothetical protein